VTEKIIQISDIADLDLVDVVEVLVKEGDKVSVDQPLVAIESEKAMLEYPSPVSGIVKKIWIQEGSQIKEGDNLITLELSLNPEVLETNIKNKEIEDTISKQSVGYKSNKNSIGGDHMHALATYAAPGTLKFARDLGVELEHVSGTGRNNRIIKDDVKKHVRKQLNNETHLSSEHSNAIDFSMYGACHSVKLNKIQTLTAKNMQKSWQSIPHVTHFDQADVTQLELHRKQLSHELGRKQIKLTPLVFVVKALALCLKKYPQFNASLDVVREELVYKDYFHIGIAVDTEFGLFVPVLRNVETKSLEQIAIELVEISKLAKQRKLKPSHNGGASMTLSSLGNLGGQAFTPIINPPEVAILGLSKIIVNENISEGGVKVEKYLPLSLSYDHRVINGADAARFCTYLKSILEDIWKLIL